MAVEKVIAPHPPNDGREWDCQCARCGSSVASEGCETCGGEGIYEDLDVDFDESPGVEACDDCGGTGTFHVCLSSAAWCEAHPLPGCEAVKRGEIEWFTFDPKPDRVSK